MILAGSTFSESVTLTGNQSSDVPKLNGALRNYGVIVIGNQIAQDLACQRQQPTGQRLRRTQPGRRSGDWPMRRVVSLLMAHQR